VSAYINRIINVAWCFGHGILLDPEASIVSIQRAYKAAILVQRQVRPPQLAASSFSLDRFSAIARLHA
jgi:hypothetical protein